ncbi:g protein-coupled receptor-related [Anaeramoeba ignava]|uniref:G protein-coupled receptor-related n=1 Tax=Anaeramoeba ignava TaxID=1746090 RepID=A0A9Q0R723_ANAIG|nr:g protein-coupled receptor-related [Anaeramoeba ignava]
MIKIKKTLKKIQNNILIQILIGIIITTLIGKVSTAKIFVSVDGKSSDCDFSDGSKLCDLIPRAVNKCVSGDEIYVYSGEYSFLNCNWWTNKGIAIKGIGGNVIIDCGGSTFGFGFNGLDDVYLENIEIRNGLLMSSKFQGNGGPAITVRNANITIKNCIFSYNQVVLGAVNGNVFAGAVLIEDSPNVLIQDSSFFNNTNPNNGGGAISIVLRNVSVSPVFIDFSQNSISGNSGESGGLEIYYLESFNDTISQINQNNFYNNLGSASGAILVKSIEENYNASFEFKQNNITTNDGSSFGGIGMVYFSECNNLNLLVDSNYITNNHGREVAGGFAAKYNEFLNNTYIQISNNFISGNIGYSGGIAIGLDNLEYMTEGQDIANQLYILNNQFIYNIGENGGACYIHAPILAYTQNNTIDNNQALQGAGFYLRDINSFSSSNTKFGANDATVGSEIFFMSIGQISLEGNEWSIAKPYDSVLFFLTSTSPIFTNFDFYCAQGDDYNKSITSPQTLVNKYKELMKIQCLPCPVGTYSLQKGTNHMGIQQCFDCPQEGLCKGSAAIYSKLGFNGIEQENGIIKFFPCPPNFCSAPSIENTTLLLYNECYNNRKGILCSQCEDNYTETLMPGEVCKPLKDCQDQVGIYILLLIPKAIWIVWSFLKIQHGSTANFHIFTFFFQILRIVLPSMESKKKDFFWMFLLSFSDIFNLQAYLPIFYNFGECPSSSSINSIQKLLMRLIGPFSTILLACFIYIIVLFKHQKLRKQNMFEITGTPTDTDSDTNTDSKADDDYKDYKNYVREYIDNSNGQSSPDELKLLENEAKSFSLEDSGKNTSDNNHQRGKEQANFNSQNHRGSSQMKSTKTEQKIILLIKKTRIGFLKSNFIAEVNRVSYVSRPLLTRINITVATLLFLTYPVVLDVVFNLTSCLVLGILPNTNQKRLFLYPELVCYNPIQKFLIFLAVVLSLLPFALFYILFKSKRVVHKICVLNIFYNPFRSKFYWFGILMMIWKVLLLIFQAYITNPITNATISTIFCIVFLITHLILKPFISIRANNIQTLSLTLLTIISSLKIPQSIWGIGGIIPFVSSTKKTSYGLYYFSFSLCVGFIVYSIGLYFRMIKRNSKNFIGFSTAKMFVSVDGKSKQCYYSEGEALCDLISRAVNKCVSGDEIYVYSGEYSSSNCNWWTNKSISIKGIGGNVIIDCGGSTFGFGFNGLGNVYLENIEIRNTKLMSWEFQGNGGPAITVRNANITIKNCIFSYNQVVLGAVNGDVFAGAVLIEDSPNVLIQDSSFFNNTNPNNGGGAISIVLRNVSVSPVFIDFSQNSISGNSGESGGLEIYYLESFNDTMFQINQNNFYNNLGSASGAILVKSIEENYNLSFEFKQNNITINNGSSFGGIGMVYFSECNNLNLLVDSNYITNNHGREVAGGFGLKFNGLMNDVVLQFDNNNISGNSGYSGGIAVGLDNLEYMTEGQDIANQLYILNNQFIYNIGENGGACYIHAPILAYTQNNTIDNNQALQGAGFYLRDINSFSSSNTKFGANDATVGSEIFFMSIGQISLEGNEWSIAKPHDTVLFFLTPTSPIFTNFDFYCAQGDQYNKYSQSTQTLVNKYKELMKIQCLPCPVGTYSLHKGTNHMGIQQCFDCPQEGLCKGSAAIYSKLGFNGIEQENGIIKFFPCPPNFCSAPSIENTTLLLYNECYNNRKGILCSQCEDNYTETLMPGEVCKPLKDCQDQVGIYILLLIPKAIWIVWSFLKIQHGSTANFHIFTFFFQILRIVLPSMESKKKDFFWMFLLSFSDIFNLQAYLPIFYNFGECPSSSSINSIQKLLMRLIGPFSTILLACFIYIIVLFKHQKLRKDNQFVEITGTPTDTDSEEEYNYKDYKNYFREYIDNSNAQRSPDDLTLFDLDIAFSLEDSGKNTSDNNLQRGERINTRCYFVSFSKFTSIPKFGYLFTLVHLQFNKAKWHLAERHNIYTSDDLSSSSIVTDTLIRTPTDISEEDNTPNKKTRIGFLKSNFIAEVNRVSYVSIPFLTRINITVATLLFLTYPVVLDVVFNLTSCLVLGIPPNTNQKRLFLYPELVCYNPIQKFLIFLAVVLSLLPIRVILYSF